MSNDNPEISDELFLKFLKDKNLYIIFSFTKLTGNANVRQGIIISNKYNIKEFEMYLSPHRINNFLKYIILNLKKKDYKRHLKELRKRKKSLELKLKPDYINNFNFFL